MVNNPSIRPAISWGITVALGGGGGGVPLNSHDLFSCFFSALLEVGSELC